MSKTNKNSFDVISGAYVFVEEAQTAGAKRESSANVSYGYSKIPVLISVDGGRERKSEKRSINRALRGIRQLGTLGATNGN